MRSSVLRLTRRLFLCLGAAALAYAGGVAAYAGIYQRYQSWKFEEKLNSQALATPDTIAPPADLHEGDLIGKLEIPRIGISVMVFHGVTNETLKLGPGHVPATPIPGGDGNVVIAGHRDTNFRKLAGILANDRIEFSTLRGTHVYLVDSTEIVDPLDTRIMESQDYPEITLITCFPFYFVGNAPKRFIVHARETK